ncbi:hypothetical protein AVEN_133673-1 [Araneus ventricosus]|uniref:Uncharacterized protein n=1 Tax=Araneus ventricosus TaxID=182803 RepID=A0A4Y2B6I8_ARAVE|nr:hypothetical protein AVEN_133673-1 [Araneus ventricosus]
MNGDTVMMMKLFEMYARFLAALSQIIQRSNSEIAKLRKSQMVIRTFQAGSGIMIASPDRETESETKAAEQTS